MTARDHLIAAIAGTELSVDVAARAHDRLMLAIGDRLAARENVLLPTVGVIMAQPVRKVDGQYYTDFRPHRAIVRGMR